MDAVGPVTVLHWTAERLHPHAEASHTEHGLSFVVSGWVRFVHGTPLQIGTGTVSVMPAGVPHRLLDGRDLECWLLGFCATCLQLDESQVLMSPFRRVRRGALPVVTIDPDRRARVLQLFEDMQAEIERGAPESSELVRCLLMLLLGEVRRAMPGASASESGAASRGGSLVADALEYIQRHCFESISLRDVARAVHRSPAHVATTIKRATGYSVGEWISAGRVAEAAACLTHTDDALDDIAERVGWADKTHFIRQFRKAYGVTPAAWRRAQRDRHALAHVDAPNGPGHAPGH